jgi:hypothetical protein
MSMPNLPFLLHLIKYNSSIAFLFLIFASSVGLAADNLNCIPPPPFGPSRPQLGIQGWSNFNGAQTVSVCTSDAPGFRIPTSATIDRLKCVSAQILAINNHQQYVCPSTGSCGVGSFASPQRKSSSAPGFDIVCITYTNSTSYSGSAGLGVVLHPPSSVKSIGFTRRRVQ